MEFTRERWRKMRGKTIAISLALTLSTLFSKRHCVMYVVAQGLLFFVQVSPLEKASLIAPAMLVSLE